LRKKNPLLAANQPAALFLCGGRLTSSGEDKKKEEENQEAGKLKGGDVRSGKLRRKRGQLGVVSPLSSNTPGDTEKVDGVKGRKKKLDIKQEHHKKNPS